MAVHSAGTHTHAMRRGRRPAATGGRVALLLGVPLVVVPLTRMVRPTGEEAGDLGLMVGTLFGTVLGAAVYRSLPHRPGSRRRRAELTQLLGTLVTAIGGGLALASAALYSSEGMLRGGPFEDAALYASWCAIVVALVAGSLDRARRGRGAATTERSTHRPSAVASEADGWARAERECPWCAERILIKARLCKHCGREVEPAA